MAHSLMESQRIVVKLGTRVLTREDGELATERLQSLLAEIIPLRRQGKEILIVTSGAVGQGRKKLGLQGALKLNEKQACAAVGQARLMHAYEMIADLWGQVVAQVLLTANDLSDRTRYLNLQETLRVLLGMGVIPVINENDTVSTRELRQGPGDVSFGDNDKLSALLAGKLDADLLILLTDVDALYTANPRVSSDAKKISVIKSPQDLAGLNLTGISDSGRGGMRSKVDSARIASLCGVNTVIASGFETGVVTRILNHSLDKESEFPGTWIWPMGDMSKRKHWIGFSSGYTGALIVNEGARQALEKKGASLLPVGIVRVDGEFEKNQTVSIQSESGDELARGLARFSSEQCRRILGKKSSEVATTLGVSASEVVHRDDLVLFSEEAES